MKWTDRQKEAITARDSNLLVAAAAGSGKTAVLIARILALVEEGTPIQDFLVVTFTKAAAGEMRERLLAGMQQRAGEGGPRAAVFAAQIMRLQEATISTLHSFCLELVRTHFQAAEVDPAIYVLEKDQADTLLDAAMDETLQALYDEGDEGFLALDEAFQEERIAAMMRTLYAFIRAQPDPWGWLEEAVEDYQPGGPRQGLWLSLYARQLREQIDGALLHIEQALSLAGSPGGSCRHAESLEEDRALLLALAGEGEASYAGLREALLSFSFPKLRAKEKDCDPDIAEQTRKQRDAAKRSITDLQKGLKEATEERLLRDAVLQGPLLRALALAVRTLDEVFTRRKRERNGADFGDLEHLALKALQSPAVRDSLRARYAYIFVDEYQDSSSIQEAILSGIRRADNCFYVGDVKQSIYRFRQARPELFLQKYRDFPPEPGSIDRRIDLNQNFRSQPLVLEAVNEVFSFAMRADAAEIEYDADARLYPGLEAGEDALPAQLLLGETHIEADERRERLRAQERLEQQAAYVAQKIASLVGTDIRDGRTGATRRIEYRDIVILMRNITGNAYHVEKALHRREIPVYSDVGSAYYEVPEVRLALCYLRLIDNPMQDEPLLAALRKGEPQVPDAGLMAIRAASPDTSFYAAARAYCGAGDALAAKLTGFFALLEEWRLRSRYQPLCDLIDDVIDRSGCYARAGALPGGRERQANLRLLSAKAASFEANGQGGLTEFLRDAEQLRAQGDTTSARTLGEGEDVVRILSMHKSKGLEFPIVFCLRLETEFSRRDTREPLLCHAGVGLGLSFINTRLRTRYRTLAQQAILYRQRQEQRAEEIRLLYVAMTRAQQRLYLLGDIDPAQGEGRWRLGSPELALRQAKSMLDVLLMALYRLPGGGALSLAGRETPQRLGAFEVAYRGEADLARETPPPADVLAIPTGWEDSEVARRLRWRMPEPPHAEALKTSVTALLEARERQPLPELIEMPDFLAGKSPTGAQVGSAWHAVMRALPLETMRGADAPRRTEQVMGCLDLLVESGVLTEELRATLRVSQILRFLESELGEQIISSDTVRREWAFNLREALPEGGFRLVQGVVDCAFLEGEEWVVVDYKTDAATDPEALVRQYAPQLGYYAKALRQITGRGIRTAYLYLVRLDESFPVSVP